MNHLLHTFNNLINDLDTGSTRTEWNESFHLVSVKYRDKVENIIEAIKKPTYLPALEENHITLEVTIGINNFYNNQFIDKYDMGILDNDELVDVTITLNKQISFELNTNTVLFFNLDSFLSVWDFSNKQM